MIVSRYGLHWAPGGIPFLVQSLGAQNLISRDLESPFVVNVRPRRLQCPHNIDLSIHEPRPDWLDDPLARMFVPTPRGKDERPVLVYDPDRRCEQLVMQLSRLCSPVEPIVRPVWWREANRMTPIFGLTNISPMVFMGADRMCVTDVLRNIEQGQIYNRRVVIVTREKIPVFDGDWITTDLTDVSREPLEAIGAGVLREYMLHAAEDQ